MEEKTSFNPQKLADSIMGQLIDLPFDDQIMVWHYLRGQFLEFRISMIKEKSEMAREYEKIAAQLMETTAHLVEGQFDPSFTLPHNQ